ncbi:MAG: hypothetical protein R3C58_01505 [Parvularculaceae bacterium]
MAERFLTLLTVSALLVSSAPAAEGLDREGCAFNGFPLHGDVQVVTSFPDIRVEIVDSFPDLDVEVVASFPDKCGQWKFVDSFPDVKIQYVTSFPDIRVRMVTSFPGIK